MPRQVPWLIFLLPFFSFVIISVILRPFLNSRPKLSSYLTIGTIGISCVLSFWVLAQVLATPGYKLEIPDISWVVINGLSIQVGLIVDSLTAIMVVIVSFVSLMIQIYSQGYMHGDPGYHRYFAFMSLFTACMLGLVMADNLVFLFLFWEGVGLGSYLLIGFWFHRPSAANAAKKAFIVTRFGDFGFLAAILLLFYHTGTFDIEELHSLAVAGTLAGTVLMWATFGIFAGAVGKSAQCPLHVWLPDAMEGPTPVSALIHAATMVAAGVFLVARLFPLFEHCQIALTTVAVIGGFTAIFAASMGLVMTDIKRVLAYSTISQLGYMMLGLGVGGIAVGIFHLFNHAFFKALLFLGAGSVNHSTGTFDMREMGGLRKAMPWTYATFLIASLSIAGIWPLAGFWSKDEILVYSLTNNRILFYLAMITVFMTAFYMFRALFLTFSGEYRGGVISNHREHSHIKLHESPAVMIAPMVALAVLSVASGWLNVTGSFSQFLGHSSHGEANTFIGGFWATLTHPLPLTSLLLAGLGIFLAYAMYSARWLSANAVGRIFRPFYVVFSRKYWFDELYERVIVGRFLVDGIFAALGIFDSRVVDGAVNGLASGTANAGRTLRRAQTGQLQAYGLAIAMGVVAIAVCFYFF